MSEFSKVVLKLLKTFHQMPPLTPDEKLLFINVERLDVFITTILNIGIPYSSEVTEDMYKFIEMYCMKMTFNNNPPTPLTKAMTNAIYNVARKYLMPKPDNMKENRPLCECFSQEEIEANPYYIIFTFVYSQTFPKSLAFYEEFFVELIRVADENLSLVSSAGAMTMLMECHRVLKEGQTNEDVIDEMVSKMCKTQDPLIFSNWLVTFVQHCGPCLCPNLRSFETLSLSLLRILFARKRYTNANCAFLSWLPHWPKPLLYGKYLQGMPRATEKNGTEVMKIYNLMMNALNIFLREETVPFFNIPVKRSAHKDDYIVALLKCCLRMLPYLTSKLEHLKDSIKIAPFNPSIITTLEAEIADIFLMLRAHIKGTFTKGELLLSIFSLKPTLETLDMVEKHSKRQYDRNGNPLIGKEFPPQECGYLAPNELFSEHPNWSEADVEDLVAMIGHTRNNLLVWTIPWNSLHDKCYQYLKLASKRHRPISLDNLERDYMTAPSKFNMVECFEPGFLQYLEDDWDCEEIVKAKKEEKLRLERAAREKKERTKMAEMRAYRRYKTANTIINNAADSQSVPPANEAVTEPEDKISQDSSRTSADFLRDIIQRGYKQSIGFVPSSPSPSTSSSAVTPANNLSSQPFNTLEGRTVPDSHGMGPSCSKRPLAKNNQSIRFNENISSAKVPRQHPPPKRAPSTLTLSKSELEALMRSTQALLSSASPTARSPARQSEAPVLIDLAVDDNEVLSPAPSTSVSILLSTKTAPSTISKMNYVKANKNGLDNQHS